MQADCTILFTFHLWFFLFLANLLLMIDSLTKQLSRGSYAATLQPETQDQAFRKNGAFDPFGFSGSKDFLSYLKDQNHTIEQNREEKRLQKEAVTRRQDEQARSEKADRNERTDKESAKQEESVKETESNKSQKEEPENETRRSEENKKQGEPDKTEKSGETSAKQSDSDDQSEVSKAAEQLKEAKNQQKEEKVNSPKEPLLADIAGKLEKKVLSQIPVASKETDSQAQLARNKYNIVDKKEAGGSAEILKALKELNLQKEQTAKTAQAEAVKTEKTVSDTKVTAAATQVSADSKTTLKETAAGTENHTVKITDANWSVVGKADAKHQGRSGDQGNSKNQSQNNQINQAAFNSVNQSVGNTDSSGSFFYDALKNSAKPEAQLKPSFEGLVEKARVNLGPDGKSSAMIRLNPEELGRMLLDLKMKGNQVTASVVVETPAAMKKLKEELELLKFELQQKGFQVENIQIKLRETFESFAHKDPSQNFSAQNENKDPSEKSENSDPSNEETANHAAVAGYEESEMISGASELHEGAINIAV